MDIGQSVNFLGVLFSNWIEVVWILLCILASEAYTLQIWGRCLNLCWTVHGGAADMDLAQSRHALGPARTRECALRGKLYVRIKIKKMSARKIWIVVEIVECKNVTFYVIHEYSTILNCFKVYWVNIFV